MLGVSVNMGCVLLGSCLGLLFGSRINQRLIRALFTGVSLCTLAIGVSSMIQTQDILCVILCMVFGVLIGELLRIDDGVEHAGDWILARLPIGLRAGAGRFTEGFVTAGIIFCVGSMSVVGSLQAGIHHDYSILYAKSVLDLISSVAFAATMGLGVPCSIVFILAFQGGIALLSSLLAPVLSEAVITEMTAGGGVVLVGMSLNMLELRQERIRVANMIPAILLPAVYVPVSNWIKGVIG